MKFLAAMLLFLSLTGCESHHSDPPPENIMYQPAGSDEICDPPEGNASRVK